MIVGFAGCRIPIVTGGAVVHDTLVIKPSTGKGRRVVAHRTILVGLYVRGMFAGRIGTVVARGAVVGNTGVIEHGGGKGAARCVADTTILGGRHVVGFGIFASCLDAVVARIAPSGQHLSAGVVDERVCKIVDVVA